MLFAYNLQTIAINAYSQCQAIAHCVQDHIWHVEFVSITMSIISTVFCVTILLVDVHDASDAMRIMLILFGCLMARISDSSSSETTKTDEYTLNLHRARPVAVTQMVLQIAWKWLWRDEFFLLFICKID